MSILFCLILFIKFKNAKGKKVRIKEVKGGCHVIVLVHGLSGSALDLRSVKNNLVSYLTNSGNSKTVKFLCSSVNEGLYTRKHFKNGH